MDVIKFSDTSGYAKCADDSYTPVDRGPSMEDIVLSMRNHLFGRNGSNVNRQFVYACSRGDGLDLSLKENTDFHGTCGHHEEKPLPSPIYQHYCIANGVTVRSGGDAEHDVIDIATNEIEAIEDACSFHQNKTREVVPPVSNGAADSTAGSITDEFDDEVSYGVLSDAEHPRLTTPFYRDLRQRYPQAFCRRSGSVVSSVDPCVGDAGGPIANGHVSDDGDASIVGCHRQRRRPAGGRTSCPLGVRTGSPQGILKKCGDGGGVRAGEGSGVSRSASTLSLKERRLRNQESMRSLLADKPFRLARTDENGSGDGHRRLAAPPDTTSSAFADANGRSASSPARDSAAPQRCRHDADDASLSRRTDQLDLVTQQRTKVSTQAVTSDSCRLKVKDGQAGECFGAPSSKDSDVDSGIANGCSPESNVNGNAVEVEVKTEPYTFDRSVPLSCAAARRPAVKRTASSVSGPLRADHNIHTPQSSFRAGSACFSSVDEARVHRGARPKVAAEVAHTARHRDRRPCSADARQRGVRFEDEVTGARPLEHDRRARSQPALDTVGRTTGLLRAGSDERLGARATSPAHAQLESSMQIHRASPVVVVPAERSRRRASRRPSPATSDVGASPRCVSPADPPGGSTEVAFFTSLMSDAALGDRPRKSRLPWRKNRGRFTPTLDAEWMRSKWTQNGNDGLVAPPSGWARSRSAGGSGSEGYDSTHGSENAYESIDAVDRRAGAGKSVGAGGAEDERGHVEVGDEEEPAEGVSEKQVHHAAIDIAPEPDSPTVADTDVIYAQVKRKNGTANGALPVRSPCVFTEPDNAIESLSVPPLPQRLYERDLSEQRHLSGSRASLADGIKSTARRTLSRLRKAVSLDRLDRAGRDATRTDSPSPLDGKKKSPSLLSLRGRWGFGGKKDVENGKKSLGGARKQTASLTSLHATEKTTVGSRPPVGKLVRMNSDGTQVIELTRPPDGPFGFYIARGNAKYNHAVFVSRLSDSLPSHAFAGLLNVGDEIRDINGSSVARLRLDAVYEKMSTTSVLVLTTLPFIART